MHLIVSDIQKLIQQGLVEDALSKIELELKSSSTPLDSDSSTQLIYLQAVCLRLKKQYQQALTCLSTLDSVEPKVSRWHQEKGYNFRALEDMQQAAIAFYQATQLNPALLSAWQALLPIYKQQKQQKAAALAQQQITELSQLPKALLAAKDMMYEGNIEAADKLCRQFLQNDKHNIQALLLLAELASLSKLASEAEFILETCIQLEPESLECRYELFKVYNKLGKFDASLAQASKLLAASPQNHFYVIAKATALVGVGRLEEGIELYEHIINTNEPQASLYLLVGHAYKTYGDIAKAIASYQRAYAILPDCGDAYWSLANTKTYRFSQQELSQMIDLTQNDSVSINDKIHVEFALGKALEDTHNYDESFNHYAQGNHLKRQQIQYDANKQTQFIDHQIATFSKGFVSKITGNGCTDKSPIFIVGLPRAGSTLLEQILASHSQVDGTMELHEILALAGQLSKSRDSNNSYPMCLANIPSATLHKLGERFIENTQAYRRGAAFFIDKMPNNFLHIGLIKSILPNAKIIDARRDPMACCFSGYKQLFGEGQEFTYSLDDIGQYYKNYLRLMDHWQMLYPGQILLVNHENVVNDTEKEVKRILAYCQLPFEQACLQFHENKRAVKTPSAEQVRQPIYKTGLVQWKNYESKLGPLKHALEK